MTFEDHSFHQIYLGLGGNIGDTAGAINSCLQEISSLPQVYNVRASKFYITSPVSDIPQPDYINAACSLQTTLSAHELFEALQVIERKHGKEPKAKNAARVIDIDLLFFGQEIHQEEDLQIPHPRWRDRLFVLVPLADLTDHIALPSAIDTTKIKHINLHELIAQLRQTSQKICMIIEQPKEK
jgi:2-amino-4-hydroxy-6-hydroxymethyldihydropteridine diphosphokinase